MADNLKIKKIIEKAVDRRIFSRDYNGPPPVAEPPAVQGERNLTAARDIRRNVIFSGNVNFNYGPPLIPAGRRDPHISGEPWIFGAPLCNPFFVGRQTALAALEHRMLDATRNRLPLVLLGMAGVGKTALAAALTESKQIRQRFPDGILWIRDGAADEPFAFPEFQRNACRPETAASDFFNLPETSGRIADYLRNKRCLVIFDDLWPNTEVTALPKLCGPDCGLLVTTRNDRTAFELTYTNEQIFTLPPLSETASFELLTLAAPDLAAEAPDLCRRLVGVYEGLPLAIQVIARLHRWESRSGRYDLGRLERLADPSMILDLPVPPDLYENDRRTTVSDILDRTTNRLSKTGRAVLTRLCRENSAGPFSRQSVTELVPATEAPQILRELFDAGLVEPMGPERFFIRRLTAAHARSLADRPHVAALHDLPE